MLKEAGPIAGVTSLSPTTVAVQAPQKAHHCTTLALANALPQLILPRVAPELLLPPLADDTLRSMHCMAGELGDQLPIRGLNRLRPKASRLGRDDRCTTPGVPRGKIHSLAFQPASSNNRLSCSCFSAIFAGMQVILQEPTSMMSTVCLDRSARVQGVASVRKSVPIEVDPDAAAESVSSPSLVAPTTAAWCPTQTQVCSQR